MRWTTRPRSCHGRAMSADPAGLTVVQSRSRRAEQPKVDRPRPHESSQHDGKPSPWIYGQSPRLPCELCGLLCSSAARRNLSSSNQVQYKTSRAAIDLLVDLSNAVDINIWQSRSETSYHRPRAAVIIFVVWRCLKSLNLCPRVYRRG